MLPILTVMEHIILQQIFHIIVDKYCIKNYNILRLII